MKNILVLVLVSAFVLTSTPKTNDFVSKSIPIEVSREVVKQYNIPLDFRTQQFIIKECEQYDLSPELAFALIQKESEFNPLAVSNTNDKGLFQLNIGTYPWIAEQLGINNFDPFNVEHNIKAGIWYLNYLRSYWQNQNYSDEEVFSLMLLSYHKGINGCKKHMKKYGLQSSYVDDVLQNKIIIEQG